jgi:hypothetical protein
LQEEGHPLADRFVPPLVKLIEELLVAIDGTRRPRGLEGMFE